MTSERLRIKDINLLQGFNGELQLVFGVDKQILTQAQVAVQNANNRLKQGKEIEVTIEPIKRRRSLDANAYFHVLCDKIANKLQLSMDDVKTNMVLSYGTPKYAVTIPNTANIADIWSYSRFIGDDGYNSQYLLYKQTHTLTTAEMARLINGTIQEAQQLGIATITPREQAELEKQWEKTYGRNTKTGYTAENDGEV